MACFTKSYLAASDQFLERRQQLNWSVMSKGCALNLAVAPWACDKPARRGALTDLPDLWHVDAMDRAAPFVQAVKPIIYALSCHGEA
jgi:hypothetical protein